MKAKLVILIALALITKASALQIHNATADVQYITMPDNGISDALIAPGATIELTVTNSTRFVDAHQDIIANNNDVITIADEVTCILRSNSNEGTAYTAFLAGFPYGIAIGCPLMAFFFVRKAWTMHDGPWGE